MTDLASWAGELEGAWRDVLGAILGYLPNLAGAVVLLLLGWVVARWLKAGILRFGDLANRFFRNIFAGTALVRIRLTERTLKLAAGVVYWLVILVFLTAAARAAELDAFSLWLNRLLSYVPVLITGALIVVAGYLASLFVRDVVAAAAAAGGARQSAFLARLAQAAVLLIAIVIGIDQIGIDVSLLVMLIAITVAAGLGGMALAFGFGSRDFVANVIAAHSLQHHYRPGQMIALGELRGEILELTPTGVVLSTEDGRATVPAQLFFTRAAVLVTPEETDG